MHSSFPRSWSAEQSCPAWCGRCRTLLRSDVGRIALRLALLLPTIGAFWCIVTAAAVTRRRTRLILDQPLRLLWQTIRGAGRPPKEPSRLFVAVAVLLIVVGWIVAPVTAALIYGLRGAGAAPVTRVTPLR